MLKIFRRSFGLTAFCAVTQFLSALEWKQTTVSVTTAPFQVEQEVTFEFTNRGRQTVAIRDLETSCSCLRADSDLKSYAPGASGKITAKFTVGDRGGLYERLITVITDEPNSPERLRVKIEVPEVAMVTPRSVAWHVNEEPAEKIVEVSSAEGLEIDFNTAYVTNEAYVARLEIVETGKRYKLHIKPTDTKQQVSAAIRITGREKSGRDVLLSAYASTH